MNAVKTTYGYREYHADVAVAVEGSRQLNAEGVRRLVDEYPWVSELSKMDVLSEQQIHWSPGIEIIRQGHSPASITMSVTGSLGALSFMVFYETNEDLVHGAASMGDLRRYVDLFLCGEDDLLRAKLSCATRPSSYMSGKPPLPNWVAATLNLLVVIGFAGLTAFAWETGGVEVAVIFGALASLFTVAFVYFSLSS